MSVTTRPPFSWENYYRLSEEILPASERLPKKDSRKTEALQKNCYHITAKGLQFAILAHANTLIRWIVETNKDLLNVATLNKKFSPLHLATIAANNEAVEILANAGADLDQKDFREWTPLHHAALIGNHVAISILTQHGASQKIQNHQGGTYQDILELAHPKKGNPNDPIPLNWIDGQGKTVSMTRESFQEVTKAVFLFENKVTKQKLYQEWLYPSSTKKSTIELAGSQKTSFIEPLKKAFATFSKMPVHVLKRVDAEVGLGLFAAREFKPQEIIGEYLGEFGGKEVGLYSLGTDLNGTFFRNALSQINDGFPNCVHIPLINTKGLPERKVFVASRTIAKGEQFLWNYGSHDVKFRKYKELNRGASRSFFQSNMDAFYRLRQERMFSHQLSFDLFTFSERYRYIASTPSVLFALIIEGMIGKPQVDIIQPLSLEDFIPHELYKSFKDNLSLALESRSLLVRLRSFGYVETANSFQRFLLKLPEKLPFYKTSIFVDLSNRFFKEKLDSLERQMDSMDDLDDVIFSVWNTLLKNYEKKIAGMTS